MHTASSILRLRSPPTFPNLLRPVLQVQFSVFLTQILERILRISPAKRIKSSPPADGSDSASLHRTYAFYPAYTYPDGQLCSDTDLLFFRCTWEVNTFFIWQVRGDGGFGKVKRLYGWEYGGFVVLCFSILLEGILYLLRHFRFRRKPFSLFHFRFLVFRS